MNNKKIIESLNILGILNINQLQENDIKFWWEKKYLSIRYDRSIPNDKKTDKLISINGAKEFLEDLDFEEVKKALREFIDNEKNSKTNSKKNKDSEEDIWSSKTENENRYRYSEKDYSKAEANNNQRKYSSEKDYSKAGSNNNQRKYSSENSNYNKGSYPRNNSSSNFFSEIKKIFSESFNGNSNNLNSPITGILSYLFIGPILVAILCSLFGLDPIELWVTIYIIIVIYFLPSVIARSRRHINFLAIFALNLFLGWTFLGWLYSLIWSLNNR